MYILVSTHLSAKEWLYLDNFMSMKTICDSLSFYQQRFLNKLSYFNKTTFLIFVYPKAGFFLQFLWTSIYTHLIQIFNPLYTRNTADADKLLALLSELKSQGHFEQVRLNVQSSYLSGNVHFVKTSLSKEKFHKSCFSFIIEWLVSIM